MGSVEQKARAMFEAQADPLAAPWERQWQPTKQYWREQAALREQPEARGVVDGWKPADVEPPHNPKKDSLGTEYLIHPPTSGGDRTAFYGRRLGGAACWYRYGAPVHGVDFWQELPADPAPPSAPVGVELDAAALGRFAQDEWMDRNSAYPAWGRLTEAEQAAWLAVGERIKRVVSLAQQPAQAAPRDDKVLWGVVANAGRLSPTRQQRWAHVMDATGQGSQSSIALCRRFGFDPDETVGVEEDTPPGDDAAGGGQ